MGKDAARIGLMFYMTNKVFNEMIIKCFSNSMETILDSIVVYYIYKADKNLNLNYFAFSFFGVINLFIRNTSPILVLPLILIKLRQ